MTRLVGKHKVAKTIVGYCWPWTVRPGESVDFMISTYARGPYQAELVRLVCGDNLSRPEMFKEQVMGAPFSGEYPGRYQQTHLGSYAEIQPAPILDSLTSFTVQTMVLPTLLPGGVRPRLGGGHNSWDDPVFQDQHLISRWDNQRQRGWALLIDETGRLVFMIGDGKEVHRAALGAALVQDKWFLVSGGVDANRHKLHVSARAVGGAPADHVAWPECRREQAYSATQRVPQVGPLRFAACSEGSGSGQRLKQAHCFNGRLDCARLAQGALQSDEVLGLSGTNIPESLESRVIGFWDFGRDIDSIAVTDLSANALHGETVNAPARAVKGIGWNGSFNDWRQCPDQYSAIHFHDDDLYDAEWEKDFSYKVPSDLRSGVYAARLCHGESEDYIPFFVAPPRHQTQANIALLIPTASYTAYANITGFTTLKRIPNDPDVDRLELVDQDKFTDLLQNAADAVFLLAHHRELGKGIYSNHTDGTLAGCSSQRHPNMTIKPKGMNWTLVADTYITDWLEQKKIPYDIITDDLLHAEGVDLLKRYAVVVTGNHPEYYTRRMLDAVAQYQTVGGRWMYMGGNGFFWATSFHACLPGLIEVRKDMYAGTWQSYEMRHASDGVAGGLWEKNGRPAQLLVGVSYDGLAMDGGAAYRRLPDSYSSRASFIFEGVSNTTIGDYGVFGGGAAGQEVDEISAERGTPVHALHLARADCFPKPSGSLVEKHLPGTKGPIADLVFFETPLGGAVFSVGSMSWVGALSHNRYDNDVSRITENVLRRFLDPTPFLFDEEASCSRT